MRVAFQGETGAFSEQAVEAFFRPVGVEAVPLPTFEAVFEAVTAGMVDRAVVPIENSLFGSVHTNYDLLREHDLTILGELKLRIVHNLMALPGQSLDAIQKVYSHPQALGQCRTFLRSKLPQAAAIPTYDTAGAAKQIAQQQQPATAAIASQAAATEYGLTILAKGIESNHHNYTRFLHLAQYGQGYQETVAPGEPMKTSIVYAMQDNVPGALFKSLAVFALRDLDLFKIESRPLVGSPFAYLFYLDVEGAITDLPVQRALDHLSEITAYLKVLGSYPFGVTVG